MPGFFKTPADNIVDGVNRDKRVIVHAVNNLFQLVDLQASDDTVQNFLALTSVTAFAVQERYAASELGI